MRRPEEMTALLQIAFDALSLGSLYAICALGIALIFGVMRLVNFAQGDYIAFCVFALLWPSIDATAIVFLGNLPWFVLVPVVLMFGAGISVASEIPAPNISTTGTSTNQGRLPRKTMAVASIDGHSSAKTQNAI